MSWTLVGAWIYNVFVAASSSTIPCGPPAAKHALAVDSWWRALLDARQLAARIVRLECVATRRAHGIVRATGEWLHYTLTMFRAVGRLDYLSGASRRRAVYCVVSSGFAASRPLVAMAVGIKQISVVSIIVSVITVIVMVITTYALHAVMYSTDRRLSCMP